MGPSEWIALGALILSVFGAGFGIVTKQGRDKDEILTKQNKDKDEILQKISDNKDELDHELGAIRMAAYEEYKTLRREMHESTNLSYREFGETIAAIREKVTDVELWIRDQLQETRHTLGGSMNMRHSIVEEKFDEVNERVRQLELSNAKKA